MIPRPALLAYLMVTCLSAGCRSRPATDVMTGGDATKTSRTYDLITRDDLVEASLLGTTAWLAIQRLRPSYLIDKTASAARTIHPLSVSVNGGDLTGLNSLITIPTQIIAEIRYLDMGNADLAPLPRAPPPPHHPPLRVRCDSPAPVASGRRALASPTWAMWRRCRQNHPVRPLSRDARSCRSTWPRARRCSRRTLPAATARACAPLQPARDAAPRSPRARPCSTRPGSFPSRTARSPSALAYAPNTPCSPGAGPRGSPPCSAP